jgi:hypothetical protein
MDAMVEAAWWWQSCWRGEDIFKVVQQHAHEISGHHGVRVWYGVAPDRALPHDAVVVAPVAHAVVREVPRLS